MKQKDCWGVKRNEKIEAKQSEKMVIRKQSETDPVSLRSDENVKQNRRTLLGYRTS
jgi:hypothetical protein